MKKLILTIALALATFTAAHAQFGVVGGWTLSKTPSTPADVFNVNNFSMWHAGIAYKFEIGPFFNIQPALVYHAKATGASEENSDYYYVRSNYVELDLGLQLGVDLLAFRPFVLVEPFVGYDVSSITKVDSLVKDELARAKNKFEGGVGVGGGIELLNHIQITAQWFANFGKLYDGDKITTPAWSDLTHLNNYQGFKLTLGFFF